jgi:alpha-galactosidase/6-phospho-beta-glucosidase family protein
MKLAVVGAGSTYTPEVVDGLVRRDLAVSELALHDVDGGDHGGVAAMPSHGGF